MAEVNKNLLQVFIPDTRGVTVSRYGRGNLKIGLSVYTYSRMPGLPGLWALGFLNEGEPALNTNNQLLTRAAGTCPGSSEECRKICYARRPVAEYGIVGDMWARNTQFEDVPPIPEDAQLLRWHVSGDFNTVAYIENWIARLTERQDVRAWGYTRSWRVPELLPALERLRALPNVQLFASMDESIAEEPPTGWRRAWIDGDPRAGEIIDVAAHKAEAAPFSRNQTTFDGTPSYVCPEETKHVPNCEACRYCITGERNDVTFLRH